MIAEQATTASAPTWFGTEYSNACPFNADRSNVLLLSVDHFILMNVDNLSFTHLPIAAGQEPRWSRTDPNVFYYLSDSRFGTEAQLRMYDCLRGTSTVITTFPYSVISGRGESDICRDGDHFAFVGDDKDIILYSLTKGREATYSQSAAFDGLKITPKAKILISGDFGIISQPGHKQVTAVNGHAAVSSYKGHDVLLWCSAADPKLNENAIMLIDLDDLSKPPRRLLHLSWPYASHISVCDKEFCLVSTYSKMDPSLPMQLYKVPFDGSTPTFLANTGGTYDLRDDARGYTSQTKAALSMDGSMAAYSVFDGSTTNVWLMTLDAVTQPVVEPSPVAPPVVEPKPVSPPAIYMKSMLNSMQDIDFKGDEGREWIWYFKVVDGKMTVKVYDL